MATVIKKGQLFLGDHLERGDLLIKNEVITEIGLNLSAEHEIDATNKVVSPGLIDVHVHYRDPGQTAKENVQTGSMAAARGGFTTVGAMPNVTPVPNTPDLMTQMVKNNQKNSRIHILQYAPITVDEIGNDLPDYAGLKKAGAFALSNDGKGVQTAQTMYLAMQKAKENGLVVAVHAQDDGLFDSGVINEGAKAKEYNLAPVSELAETTQIARDLLLAEKTGVRYHICHVSTATSVELVRIAKSRGIKVTCEAAPHHLLLTDQDILQNDGNFKMNPPLRSPQDRQALINGLLDGTIDLIATDHAPHTKKDKEGGFAQAAFGITGSETVFSELYTHYVKTGVFTLEQLLSWLTVRPASAFKLKHAGRIALNEPADLTIFDLKKKTKVCASDYESKSSNTPFTGDEVYGQTELTMVDGKIVYQKKGN